MVQDILHVATPDVPPGKNVTKRWIASVTAKVYDVLGLYSPFVIVAKVLLQQLWKDKVDWDESVPANILLSWNQWTDELTHITQHPVPRKYSHNTSPIISTSLHGYSDASQTAYGAVVYIRHVHSDSIVSTSRLRQGQSMSTEEVHPTARTSSCCHASQYSPLCGKDLRHSSSPCSSLDGFLQWLKKMPCALKAFVAHRVALIQDLLSENSWRHVSTDSNPADLVSRGITAANLIASDLWWHDPSWLCHPEQKWPSSGVVSLLRVLPELNTVTLTTVLSPVELGCVDSLLQLLYSSPHPDLGSSVHYQLSNFIQQIH